MYHADVFTVGVPLAGNPGLNIPTGFSQNNLPFGLQLVGRPFEEDVLFQLGYAHELEHKWYEKVPTV